MVGSRAPFLTRGYIGPIGFFRIPSFGFGAYLLMFKGDGGTPILVYVGSRRLVKRVAKGVIW